MTELTEQAPASRGFGADDLTSPLMMLIDPAVHADPYPYYKFLRDNKPIAGDGNGMWFVTSHALADEVLTSSQTTTQASNIMATLPMPDDLWTQYYNNELLFTDAQRHAFLRTFANAAFKPRRVRKLRPQLEADVDSYLDKVAGNGSMDVVADLAHPFAILTVMRMIGIPAEAVGEVDRWSTAMGALLDVTKLLDPAYRDAGIAAFAECIAYIDELLEERKKNPQDDVLSDFVATVGQTDGLTNADIMGIVIRGMLNAGHVTTTSQIGNGTLALLKYPEQLRKLREQPEIAPNAVEELFRYDGAIQLSVRGANEPMAVGGENIEEGELLWVIEASANRDEAVFENPDVLDFDRKITASLASGAGEHYCLGGVLARLEVEIALTRLFNRFSDISLVGTVADIPRDANITLRTPTSVPISFDGS